MKNRKVILVIDDDKLTSKFLGTIFPDRYELLHADSAIDALEIIKSDEISIDAVLLDLVMPVMDGFEFIEHAAAIPQASTIPFIVYTSNENKEVEMKAIAMGAADFITKNSSPEMLLQRIDGILDMFAATSLKKQVERDALTGLYNRNIFFHRAEMMLKAGDSNHFAIVTTDIERFNLINEIYGVEEGDRLLVFVAEKLLETVPQGSICGRIGGDIFAALIPLDEYDLSEETFSRFTKEIDDYPINFEISLKHGVYYVTDPDISLNAMCDRARLASESIKGSYGVSLAFYDDSLRTSMLQEQQLLNDMETALAQKQFQVYLQPKFDLVTEEIVGAEALVRWIHPQKGFISPAQFIPLFERTGFITELDRYVWDAVCGYIRRWKEEGIPTVPISVNVSRIDIYKLNLDEIFPGLLEKYGLPASCLHLEITESAYTENPRQIVDTVQRLHDLGFHIEMDDFGTGYSSLNMLNELPLDTLKLDMRFLQGFDGQSSKGNILNFIVSLAKWMTLSVVAEGVETREQVLFLRSMGCNIGQGYYFAKPMPCGDFEKLVQGGVNKERLKEENTVSIIAVSDIWNPASQFNSLFNCHIGALGLFETSHGILSFIRGNDEFFNELKLSRSELYNITESLESYVLPEDRESFMADVQRAAAEPVQVDNCSRWRIGSPEGNIRWLQIKISLLNNSGEKSVLVAAIEDITDKKLMAEKLEMRQAELLGQHAFLEKIYDFTACGMAQLRMEDMSYVRLNGAMARLLGFDSVQEFISQPRTLWDFVGEDCKPQVEERLPALAEGKYGSYISVEHGVLTHNGRRVWVQCMMQKINTDNGDEIRCVITDSSEVAKSADEMAELARRDKMTGLLTRLGLELEVREYLSAGNRSAVMMIVDIDNFRNINRLFGQEGGDKALSDIAAIIKSSLRTGDVIARTGGDEFTVLMKNFVMDFDTISARGSSLCRSVSKYRLNGIPLSCSAGISVCPTHGFNFEILYACADAALYRAKKSGKNMAVMYDADYDIINMA